MMAHAAATFLPLRMAAAAADMSDKRPLVQLPTTTWSIFTFSAAASSMVCVFGQMGEGDCGRMVDRSTSITCSYGASASGAYTVCVLRLAVHVGAGHVVHLENAVFASWPRCSPYRRTAAVVDGKAGQPRPAELHAFIKRAVHADPADDAGSHHAAGMAL